MLDKNKPWEHLAFKDYAPPSPSMVYYNDHTFGACWSAIHTKKYVSHVIKLFYWEVIENCLTEIKTIRQLKDIDHPHLVKLIDLNDKHRGLGVYYVMEEWGEKLTNFIRHIKIDPNEAIKCVMHILDGLDIIHNKLGRIHRDIKPDNIFFKDGVCKIGDYGAVTLKTVSSSATAAGTLGYMPPEMLDDYPYPEHRNKVTVDIYSTGIILRQLLTHQRPPYYQTKGGELIYPLPQELWNIINKATDPVQGNRYKSAIGFRTAIENYRKNSKVYPEYQKLIGNLFLSTITLYNQGKYREAIPIAKIILKETEGKRGKDHPDTAVSLNNLAALYYANGDNASAKPLFKKALVITEKALGTDHPYTAVSLNNLAALYYANGNNASAKPLFKKALVITEKALGTDHPDTAVSLNNLAMLYQDKRDYTLAEPLLKRALEIREKTLGADHPDTAVSLNNLAMLYQDKRDYASAEPLFKRALVIKEQTLGADHPDTAVSLNSLALLYYAKHNYAKAEPLCQRAISICEKVLGYNHPHTKTFRYNLARLRKIMGKTK
ncbi:MAG: tetratricopeptide repeat-containing protein kinase family protein [Planctomycetota bacterium]